MKASRIDICIFTWQRTDGGQVDINDLSTWPEKEQIIGTAMANALAQIQFSGKNPPVYWDLCSLSNQQNGALNQEVINRLQINPSNLPIMHMYAEYPPDSKHPSGSAAQYVLGGQGALDNLLDTFTTEAVKDRIERLWDGRVSTKKGIICTLVPKLCDLPGWFWLIAAGYTTFEATTSKDTRRVVYGGAAAVLWYEFFQRGGFDWIKNKSN
jgi:hypothetical protein